MILSTLSTKVASYESDLFVQFLHDRGVHVFQYSLCQGIVKLDFLSKADLFRYQFLSLEHEFIKLRPHYFEFNEEWDLIAEGMLNGKKY